MRRKLASVKGIYIGILAFLWNKNPGILCPKRKGKVNAWTCIASFQTCSACWRILSSVQKAIAAILSPIAPSAAEQIIAIALGNINTSFRLQEKAPLYTRKLTRSLSER